MSQRPTVGLFIGAVVVLYQVLAGDTNLRYLICESACFHCDCVACREDQFQCQNGRCIRARAVCDGHNDCRDLSDERNCSECYSCSFSFISAYEDRTATGKLTGACKGIGKRGRVLIKRYLHHTKPEQRALQSRKWQFIGKSSGHWTRGSSYQAHRRPNQPHQAFTP